MPSKLVRPNKPQFWRPEVANVDELEKKLWFKILRVVIILLIFVVFSCFFIPMIVYELTPWRRRFLANVATTVLNILACQGETEAHQLRQETSAELQRKVSIGPFYSIMGSFQDAGLVERRQEKDPEETEYERFIYYYKLTDARL